MQGWRCLESESASADKLPWQRGWRRFERARPGPRGRPGVSCPGEVAKSFTAAAVAEGEGGGGELRAPWAELGRLHMGGRRGADAVRLLH